MATPPSYPASSGYLGARDFVSGTTDYTANRFLIDQVLARLAGSALVQVMAVTNAGTVTAVGYVDVQPMVNQVDGAGNAVSHGVIHNVPYFRLQGGANAIILDPQVGDIGIAVFADRDISSVKQTRSVSNPGSRRKNNMADGLYLGGFLNGLPTQIVTFSATGINVTTTQNLTIQAANLTLDAAGNLAAKGEITRGAGGADQVTLGQHKHGTGSAAAGTSVPTPGM